MDEEPEELEPGFVRQLQAAVDRGQVVLIPARPDSKAPRQPAPPRPRNRSEAALTAAYCLLFKMSRSESGIFVFLLTHDVASKDDLRNSVSALVGRTVSDSTVHTVLSSLRKKLEPDGIRISTVGHQGYGFDRDARFRIRSLLAKHDSGFPMWKTQSERNRSRSRLLSGMETRDAEA